jgi:Rv0078B-related antitoxin
MVLASQVADRFRIALELYEVGENMLRQRLRRERPEASMQDIDAAIAVWLQRRSGAEYGDHPGPPSSRQL